MPAFNVIEAAPVLVFGALTANALLPLVDALDNDIQGMRTMITYRSSLSH